MKKRIFIVDDHPLVIEGFRTLLSQNEKVIFSGSAANAIEALEFLRAHAVDIAFLDINLPEVSGIELCGKIRADFPKVRCIALSTFADRSYISSMIGNGAMGYLLKNCSGEELFDAIAQVASGQMYLSVDLSKTPASRFEQKPVLTRRELEVLREIADGYTNQQIAERLFIGATTVSTHRQNLMLKLDARNTASMLKAAIGFGLL